MQNNMSVTINNQYFAIRLIKNTIILQYISAIHTCSTVTVISLCIHIYMYTIAYYSTSPKPEMMTFPYNIRSYIDFCVIFWIIMIFRDILSACHPCKNQEIIGSWIFCPYSNCIFHILSAKWPHLKSQIKSMFGTTMFCEFSFNKS